MSKKQDIVNTKYIQVKQEILIFRSCIVSNNICKCFESSRIDSEKAIDPFCKLNNGLNKYRDHCKIS